MCVCVCVCDKCYMGVKAVFLDELFTQTLPEQNDKRLLRYLDVATGGLS